MERGEADFKKKSILVLCWAGSDRSRLIAEELNHRGYFAESRGVMSGQNYVTREDLLDVGILVFSSKFEKDKFDKDSAIRKFALQQGIEFRVLNITEDDKDKAFSDQTLMSDFQDKIRENLDSCGLKGIDGKQFNK